VDPGAKIAAILKVLRARGVQKLDQVVILRPLPHGAWKRLRRGVLLRGASWVNPPWSFCEKEICFEFGGDDGPRVLRGEAQYSIIPGRLKLGAVEVSTDGRTAEIL
jgi:hypothetical protein